MYTFHRRCTIALHLAEIKSFAITILHHIMINCYFYYSNAINLYQYPVLHMVLHLPKSSCAQRKVVATSHTSSLRPAISQNKDLNIFHSTRLVGDGCCPENFKLSYSINPLSGRHSGTVTIYGE